MYLSARKVTPNQYHCPQRIDILSSPWFTAVLSHPGITQLLVLSWIPSRVWLKLRVDRWWDFQKGSIGVVIVETEPFI